MAGAKILVIDDEPIVRNFLSRLLADEGYLVETASHAEDALEMVMTNRYRLILLDIKMSGMSGIELYEHFQKMTPSVARRIVFVTSDVMGADTREFL